MTTSDAPARNRQQRLPGRQTPISTVFENIEDMSVDELVEEFGVTPEQVHAVLEFAAHSAEPSTPSMHS